MDVDRRITVFGLYLPATSIGVSIFLSLYSLYKSDSIAIESGAFKKPNIHAYIDQMSLTKHKTNNIVFGVNNIELKRGLVVSTFTINIINNGDKNLENLYMTYRYNNILRRSALENLNLNIYGTVVDGYFSRKFSSSPTFDFVTYHFADVNPSITISIDEPFVLHETKISDVVELENYKLPYLVYYSIQFQLNIGASIFPHQDYNFDVSVIKSHDLNDLQTKFEEQYLVRKLKNIRERSSALSYLGMLLFGNERQSTVLIYPHNQEIGSGENIVYFPNKGNVEYRTVNYKPASWSMLLH